MSSFFAPHLADTDPRRTSVTTDVRTETPARMRWRSGGGSASGVNLMGATNASAIGFGVSALAPNVAMLNQASTSLSVRCGRCSKPLHASEATQRMTGHAGWACSRHTTTADPANVTCALCHLTVRGLFVWCRGCSHGGHLEHMQVCLRLVGPFSVNSHFQAITLKSGDGRLNSLTPLCDFQKNRSCFQVQIHPSFCANSANVDFR